MKAGIAGSSPDGVSTKAHPATYALGTFLREVGEAVFCLNTTVVGLDAVEKGHQKPDGLDISWNPADRKIAARKTRKFVIVSVLVHVTEALNQYVIALSKLPQFEVLRSSWSKKGADLSAASKLEDISSKIVGSDDFRIAGASLLIDWRNRVAHEASRAQLKPQLKTLLHKNEEEISDKYRQLNVDRLLSHFEEGRPTLKDISSLIAMTTN